MPKKAHKQLFQPKHKLQYRLVVVCRESSSGKATLVVCRFCSMFGRKEKLGAKRKVTERSKYYTTFLMDHYLQHLNQHHSSKWEECKGLETENEKENFSRPLKLHLPTVLKHTMVDKAQQSASLSLPHLSIQLLANCSLTQTMRRRQKIIVLL